MADVAAQLLSELSTEEGRKRFRAQRKLTAAFKQDQVLLDAWETDCFHTLLVFLKRDEAEVLLFDAVENLAAGRRPFLPGYPFDGDGIRSVLEAWREGAQGKGACRRRPPGNP